jgi:hypothetical protein
MNSIALIVLAQCGICSLWKEATAAMTVVLYYSTVLDHGNQFHDTVLMSVYLEVRNLGGSGFRNEGLMSKGRELGSSVYKQTKIEVD